MQGGFPLSPNGSFVPGAVAPPTLKPIFSSNQLAQVHSEMKLVLMGSLTEHERTALTPRGGEDNSKLLTGARVTMVMSWIIRRVLSREKHEPLGGMRTTNAPTLGRLYSVMSDAHQAFSQAAMVAEVPFPMPYQNLIRLMLWLFWAMTPFIVNSKIFSLPMRFVVNFITVLAYFSVATIGDIMEDPFMPYDPNELPLVALQESFNLRLLATGIVPRRPKKPLSQTFGVMPQMREGSVCSMSSSGSQRPAASLAPRLSSRYSAGVSGELSVVPNPASNRGAGGTREPGEGAEDVDPPGFVEAGQK